MYIDLYIHTDVCLAAWQQMRVNDALVNHSLKISLVFAASTLKDAGDGFPWRGVT